MSEDRRLEFSKMTTVDDEDKKKNVRKKRRVGKEKAGFDSNLQQSRGAEIRQDSMMITVQS